MIGIARKVRHSFPLRVHIATLFTALILATGLGICFYVYQQSQSAALKQAQDGFERTAREMAASLERLYIPTGAMVNLLSKQPVVRATSLTERLQGLEMLHEILSANPQSVSFYIGYPNGDFFLFRPLDDELTRRSVDAPEGVAYAVQSVDYDAQQNEADRRYLFYTADLHLIKDQQRPDYQYDPRNRPWYKQALAKDGLVRTDPFATFTTGELGLAFVRRNKHAIIAATLTLTRLSATLATGKPTASAQLALFDDHRRLLAYPDSRKLLVADRTVAGGQRPANLDDLDAPILKTLLPAGQSVVSGTHRYEDSTGREWLTALLPIDNSQGSASWLALTAPTDELFAEARSVRNKTLLATLLIVALSLPLIWMLSAHIAGQLRNLTEEAQRIHRFEFDGELLPHSNVQEVAELANAVGKLKRTIRSFLDISQNLAAETYFDRLLDRVLEETLGAANAEGGAIYLLDENGACLKPAAMRWQDEATGIEGLLDIQLTDETDPLVQAIRDRRTENLVLTFPRPPVLSYIDQHFGDVRVQLIAPPLTNRAGELIGVLCLFLPSKHATISAERVAFVEALSGTAAVAIENQMLFQNQKALLDCFITLIAGAIDAKSPYTGGHCQRVPELTQALAQAAHDVEHGPFKDYRLTDEDREVLHIACWLHDCGKVTTPEYVVDKATKLETIYDRIHEVRMRFEVLKRDADIDYWQGVANGGNATVLVTERDTLKKTLDEEFAFVAECNTGGEFMAADKLERLHEIAKRRWLRTLDDTLGLSWAEKQRKPSAGALPMEEPLLADKAEHLITRHANDVMLADNRWGFKLKTPEYKFNHGELYNLSIRRGTLTEEERYVINDHIVQTIIMLNSLPLPKHLQRVPEIAGGHHEKMDGTGYPKRLRRDEMSVEARMMAIADIFEALTAVDRPYKIGKTLSESLTIMDRMQREGHIDAELFTLFLESGIYLSYAKRYLKPEQIDSVDIQSYLN